jgi:energy-coupling factor transporter ATP-binding protein EcfA2
MNTFVFIHGPNGVGKSTVCKAVHHRLSHSAWLESEWCRMTHPFVLNGETIPVTIGNITHILRSYLACSWLDYVIFSYGFHGPRRQIWETVLSNLQDIPYVFAPITLTCDREENITRMVYDGRDQARIQHALAVGYLYDALPYPKIDTTHLTIEQTADRVIEIVQGIRHSHDKDSRAAEHTERAWAYEPQPKKSRK